MPIVDQPVEPSLRTLAFMSVYVAAGLVSFLFVLAIAANALVVLVNRPVLLQIPAFPWFPAAALLTLTAKSAARLSYAHDVRRAAES